jgi:hypothetical protein
MQSTTVRAAPLAVDVRAAASVTDLVVGVAERGVLVRRGVRADLQHVTIEASRVGVKVEGGGDAALAQSRLVAPSPVDGAPLRSSIDNTLTVIGDDAPIPWLAAAAITVLVLAVGLELFRTRRDPERVIDAPAGVWNIA